MIKRSYWLLALALAGSGCLNPMGFLDMDARKDKPMELPPVQPHALPPPAVTPDEVTEENAAEAIEAMSREMDYDEAQRPSPLPHPTTPPVKQNAKNPY